MNLYFKPNPTLLSARSGAGSQFRVSGVLQKDADYRVLYRIGVWARLETLESRWVDTTTGTLTHAK